MSDWKLLLQEAKELFENDLITQEEYDQMRTEALAKRTESTKPPSMPPNLDDLGTRIQTIGVESTTSTFGLDDMGTVIGKVGEETIGSYRILELLGQGGMGAVYKGRHKNEQVAEARGDVAIKMIHPSLAKDEDFKTRFVKEGLFGMSLQHPNIAKVTEVIDEQGLLAVVMEYIEGQELKDMIPTNGMSVDEVIRLLKPIALALDHLHEKGIVHRDMKPANVRIKPDGTPVILDFGIAKDTNEADSGMTQTGTAMGTQTYMAPEQMDAKRVTGAADQYALAMMAYQMLSGRLPWAESISSAGVTVAKMTGVFTSLDGVARVSDSLNQVVMKGLHLLPAKRFSCCEEFVIAMETSGIQGEPLQKTIMINPVDALEQKSSQRYPVLNGTTKVVQKVQKKTLVSTASLVKKTDATEPAAVATVSSESSSRIGWLVGLLFMLAAAVLMFSVDRSPEELVPIASAKVETGDKETEDMKKMVEKEEMVEGKSKTKSYDKDRQAKTTKDEPKTSKSASSTTNSKANNKKTSADTIRTKDQAVVEEFMSGLDLSSHGGGVGGGGTADGVGGLGTKGSGRGSSGYGKGGDSLGKKRSAGSIKSGGTPIILGALDKSLIDNVIRKNMNQIRYCYQRELTKNPGLKGKIIVKFTVAADGSVSKSRIKTSSMGSKAVEGCITSRFERFKFPQPKGGGVVIVSYPFIFGS